MFNALISYIPFYNCKLYDTFLYVNLKYLFVTFGWQYTIDPLFSAIWYFLLGSNKIGGLKLTLICDPKLDIVLFVPVILLIYILPII